MSGKDLTCSFLGGLLAAAIASMDGIGGKKGWEWIFIIEGLLTVIVAVFSFWMVHDFPDTARFLNAEESKKDIIIVSRDCSVTHSFCQEPSLSIAYSPTSNLVLAARNSI